MTHPFEQDQLPPTLRAVEHELAERLREACSKMEVSEESTGELMRLEDTLLDAARAAKQAVSVRRRLRSRAEAAREARDSIAAPVAGAPAAPVALADAAPLEGSSLDGTSSLTPQSAASASAEASDVDEIAVRNLVDPTGVEWQVWEVSPSAITRTGAVLSDYREGWLAFESVDGTRHKRLPNFPREWTKLTNLELEHLLGRADEVKRRVRTRLGTSRPAPSEGPAPDAGA